MIHNVHFYVKREHYDKALRLRQVFFVHTETKIDFTRRQSYYIEFYPSLV